MKWIPLVKVFAFDLVGENESKFILFEDDGETIEYQNGDYRTTNISQKRTDNSIMVTVHGSSGTYSGAPDSRNNLIELVVGNRERAKKVTLNGEGLTKHTTLNDFEASSSGWINSGRNTIKAKSGVMRVDSAKDLVFTLDVPPPCTSEFDSISVPCEGNGWNPADPDRTLSCKEGKIWTGRIMMCNEEYKFAANGSWRVNWSSDGKQDGPNFQPLKSETNTVVDLLILIP